MKPEHKALIGKRCIYQGEYQEFQNEQGTIVNLLESIIKPYDIILCCVKLDNDTSGKGYYTVGCKRDEIEVLNAESRNQTCWDS